jgi:hypothetical protein
LQQLPNATRGSPEPEAGRGSVKAGGGRGDDEEAEDDEEEWLLEGVPDDCACPVSLVFLTESVVVADGFTCACLDGTEEGGRSELSVIVIPDFALILPLHLNTHTRQYCRPTRGAGGLDRQVPERESGACHALHVIHAAAPRKQRPRSRRGGPIAALNASDRGPEGWLWAHPLIAGRPLMGELGSARGLFGAPLSSQGGAAASSREE